MPEKLLYAIGEALSFGKYASDIAFVEKACTHQQSHK